MNFEFAVNEAIRSNQVRLVDEAGEQVGVIPTREALARARAEGLDLVAVSEKSDPPVCKIIDYGKYKFELAKAEKERAKKARATQTETKEIQLRPVTDIHDLEVKAKHARDFLNEGDRVKIVVKFKGREISHADMGRQVLQTFLDLIGEHKVEKHPSLAERNMICQVAPLLKK